MPKFTQPRDQRACGMTLLPASIFRSVKSIEVPESLGLGRVRRGQASSKEAEGYRAFESKSLLWAREQSQ